MPDSIRQEFDALLLKAKARYDELYRAYADDGFVDERICQDVLNMVIPALEMFDEVVASAGVKAGKDVAARVDSLRRAKIAVDSLKNRPTGGRFTDRDVIALYDSLEALESLKQFLKKSRVTSHPLRTTVLLLALLALSSVCVWIWLAQDDGFRLDLISGNSTLPVAMKGLDDPEHAKGLIWRWSLGRDVFINFDVARKEPCVLDLSINNYIPGQQVEIYINERLVRVVQNIPSHSWDDPGLSLSLPFMSVSGKNRIHLVLSEWNHKQSKEYVADQRPLGVKFFRISLRSDTPRERIMSALGIKTQR